MDNTDTPSRHVLFLNWRDTTNPEGGGSEVYIERIAAELVTFGHRVTLLCAAHDNAGPAGTTESGVRVLRRGSRMTVYLRAALVCLASRFGLGPLSRRGLGRPDLIVDVCNGVPFFAPLYAGRPVIALVHHVHREQWPVVFGPWMCRLGWWIESWLAVRLYRRCRYVTVSEATRAELATLGVDAERIDVVPNGTPPVTGPSLPRTRNPSLLVLGRLVPHKRVEIALRTVAELAAELPELELVVAGQGWWEEPLRERCAALGISDRVRFTGFVSEEEKHALLCSAWLALTPSLKEGWGLTIVEAAARSTPTVAFRYAGGVAEAMVDTETGLLVDDEREFTAAVRELLADDVRRKAMGEAALSHAARYTWTATGARFAQLVTAATPRSG
ncbi:MULTISPECIES: glycosyltransferase family 4 protein [unclassified Micromonospora]|uniref:glycosyltransferase family 4 protein n=1 Tax=unclassified Micromonospora TaxID=2617518 RepID=UPI0022B638E3|nr:MULTISPECIES: glycosyltransferase family 4 protein [unclassified Micromonospora]MCZ7417971.1 glycosyltransferase family 4 protein [Verrucosispora sp. WMMA2121]MCZ7419558.1 glycosyltransferase family 4 protein [Verrucosispora sp. WMMA2121]MCZ7419577.1 glycosyltransferase family 4 protein [Verrucosispora sp. WMMA2121]WBB93187.1 glycosyltransferase family 4 protein [Verrucosispora sp. WMMC514]